MNVIKNWTWEKPSEEGDYFVCYGDVETQNNISYMRLQYNEYSELVDQDGENLQPFNEKYKWAKIEYGDNA